MQPTAVFPILILNSFLITIQWYVTLNYYQPMDSYFHTYLHNVDQFFSTFATWRCLNFNQLGEEFCELKSTHWSRWHKFILSEVDFCLSFIHSFKKNKSACACVLWLHPQNQAAFFKLVNSFLLSLCSQTYFFLHR